MRALDWRDVYFGALALKVCFALSNSYNHPDEHFQNFEVLSNRFLNYSTRIPWEFTSDNPARSFAPLYIIYGPILAIISYFNIQVEPIRIMYLFRMQFCLLSWLITEFCIHRLLPSKPERVKALFFLSTSYITLVHQNHCFSNSVETLVVLLCLVLIDRIRGSLESNLPNNHNRSLFMLGVLSSFGLFNRLTFPAFLIFPGWFLVKHFWIHKRSIISIICGFLITSSCFVSLDTYLFQSSSYVFVPFNSLVYNTNKENLSIHGLHPYYTHILINLPQILGPGLLFILFSKKYKTTLPFLSAVSALLCLSIVPHQEMRFLVPILPLLCCCFDLTSLSSKSTRIAIYLWYTFNIIMSVLMGVFHQGGVIPALAHLQSQHHSSTVQIWWRTYMPPTWLLGDEGLEFADQESVLKRRNSYHNNTVIDLMGANIDDTKSILKHLKKFDNKVLLILPTASFSISDFSDFNLNLTYKYTYHIDMDHLDFGNIASLEPGLGIYELI